jgi:chromosomal replication initiation ATPase DnaA
VKAAEMRERARERRARLWSGGVKSSELDVVSPVELRRRIATRRQEVQRAEQQKRLAQVIEAAAECQEAYRLTPFASRGPRQQCADITKACCLHFHLTRMQITSRRRTPAITYPRQIAMYLMAEFTPNSLPEIGRRMSGFDHTTVLHAQRRIKERIEAEENVKADVNAIRQALGIGEPTC